MKRIKVTRYTYIYTFSITDPINTANTSDNTWSMGRIMSSMTNVRQNHLHRHIQIIICSFKMEYKAEYLSIKIRSMGTTFRHVFNKKNTGFVLHVDCKHSVFKTPKGKSPKGQTLKQVKGHAHTYSKRMYQQYNEDKY